VRLVANLPYNVASPLVIEMLLAGVRLLAFTVQKEVADRLVAGAGSEAYGPLSVMAQVLGLVEVLRTLPRQAFWPVPKIESALVRVRRRDDVPTSVRSFGVFVRSLFGFRRKTLRRALTQAGHDADTVLRAVTLDPQRRPETLEIAELLSLFRAL
jgi:16S rRNA (adenine1518-N6/adenine1519-N6)-dimethyltransferase